MGDIKFTQSARRGRIGKAHALHVMKNPYVVFDEDAPEGSPYTDDRTVFLGDDTRGLALEIMAIALDNGDLLVIHVRPMANRYREFYEMGKARQT